MFKMLDEKGPDEKILCIMLVDPHWNHSGDLSGALEYLLKEIEHFFSVYKELEKKKTGVESRESQKHTLKVIKLAKERFRSG